MRIYISGQISDLLPDRHIPLFERAEHRLVKRLKRLEREVLEYTAHEIVNPLRLDHSTNSTWEQYMSTDITALLSCDAIYMMTNWGRSRGARLEYAIARELNLTIWFEADDEEISEEEAA